MSGRPRAPSAPPPAAVKLLASSLLSLASRPPGTPLAVARAEALGVVVSRERRDKYLRFLIDDGTGCVPCILWLNQRRQPWLMERLGAADVEARAEWAEGQAEEEVRLGRAARVRGRVTEYRGEVQITVGDVREEIDPNAELLHWLECIKYARSRGNGDGGIHINGSERRPRCRGMPGRGNVSHLVDLV